MLGHEGNGDRRTATERCDGPRTGVDVGIRELAADLSEGPRELDEIGMEDVAVAPDLRRDPAEHSRDGYRTPMVWERGPGAGFTTGRPWLPLGRLERNVAEQRADPGSLLHFVRDLLQLRRSLSGPYRRRPSADGRWRYRRGDTEIELDFAGGRVEIT